MKQNQTIRVLAIINLISLPLFISLSFYLESSLPPMLIEYLKQDSNEELTTVGLVAFFVSVPALIANFIALFGILFFKLWARSVLLVSNALMYAVTPFLGPYVDHGLSAMVGELTNLLLGALLSLLYFGDSAFNKPSQQDAASGVIA